MAEVERKYPYVDMHEFNCESLIPQIEKSFMASVREATEEAIREGIKANTIIINENMVRVPDSWFITPMGPRQIPAMICGLNVYLTPSELPDGYSFAVVEGPENRLARFESIGMEPDELLKAAELYRKIKEVMGDGSF